MKQPMKLGAPVLKILAKVYPPLEMIDLSFKRYDLRIKTNQDGSPILLFIGRKAEDGTIKGERFARTLQFDKEGRLVKDHWDNKGKV